MTKASRGHQDSQPHAIPRPDESCRLGIGEVDMKLWKAGSLVLLALAVAAAGARSVEVDSRPPVSLGPV